MSHCVLILNLTVDHLGPSRAGRYLLWCKLAAERFSPGHFALYPHYENHERLGYVFIMPDRLAALRMAVYGSALVASAHVV